MRRLGRFQDGLITRVRMATRMRQKRIRRRVTTMKTMRRRTLTWIKNFVKIRLNTTITK